MGTAVAAFMIYYFFLVDRGDIFERAMTIAARGNYADARGMLRGKLDREPDNPVLHYQMSRIYGLEGDTKNELYHLHEIIKKGVFNAQVSAVDVYNRVGSLYYDVGEYLLSFQFYHESLSVIPRNEEALARLGFMAIGQEEYEIAESQFFSKLIELQPKVPEYHIARGVGLSMLKKKSAMEELSKAVELKPDDATARFLAALHAFSVDQYDVVASHVEALQSMLRDNGIRLLLNRMAAASYFQLGKFEEALSAARKILEIALEEGWDREVYDARLSIALLCIGTGNLEEAGEHLLELEIHNPADENVMRIADFRMDLEEGIAELEEVSPRGFDYHLQMKEWIRTRFPATSIYKLSGLKMEEKIDILPFFAPDGSAKPITRTKTDNSAKYQELVEKFNELKEAAFLETCSKIINSLGCKMDKMLPRKDRDGADFLAKDLNDKKIRALFSIRQWSNQPISDIFLRNMQNTMNELKVNKGFVIAGARLTPGAESALQNLKKITVVNENELGELLIRVMES